MALGLLWIIFIVIAVISLFSIAALFMVKDPRGNRIVFGFTAILGLIISYMAFTALPTNMTVPRVFSASMGVLTLVSVILRFMNKTLSAKILVSASVILGLTQLFFF
ncbi:hypothetical protein [Paenibacillus dakarensis]|uniref:hypothetical protein n=1 Tax=Paenibacillus dakarensis TaxID=1527293 RepID=UPI0006D5B728|nr:hypothetical protein [Paenibacillus dakarensis]